MAAETGHAGSGTMAPAAARAKRGATALVWIHALLYGLLALVCYLSPETAFGDSGWLPLARFSALLFAGALTAVVVALVGMARSGLTEHLRLALLAALVFDVQVPILAFSQPASLEYLDADVGLPWFLLPLVFLILIGATVYYRRRLRAPRH